MPAAECCACGADFENGTVHNPKPRSRHRCTRCRRLACWDCILFDADGRMVCTVCWPLPRTAPEPG